MLEADDGEGIIDRATESIEKLKEAGEALKKELKEFSDKLPEFFENTKATLDVVSKEIDTMLPGDSFLSKISSGISSMTRALFGSQNSPVEKISKMAYDLNAVKAMIAAVTQSIVKGIQDNQAESLKDPEVKKEFDSKKSELMSTPINKFKDEDVEKFGLPTPDSLAKFIEPALKPPDGMFAGFKKLSKSLGFDVGGKMPFEKYLSKEEFIEDFMNSTPEELASISKSAPKGDTKPTQGTQQVGAALQQVQQVQDAAENAEEDGEGGEDAEKAAQKQALKDAIEKLKIPGLDLKVHSDILSDIILGDVKPGGSAPSEKKESISMSLKELIFESLDLALLFEAPDAGATDKVKIPDYSALMLLSHLSMISYAGGKEVKNFSMKNFKNKKPKKKYPFRARDAFDIIVKAVAKNFGAKPKEKGLKAVPNPLGKSASPGDYAIWGYDGVDAELAEKLAKNKLPDQTYGGFIDGVVARKGKDIKLFLISKYKTNNKAGLAAEAWLEGDEIEDEETPEEAEGKGDEEGNKGEEGEHDVFTNLDQVLDEDYRHPIPMGIAGIDNLLKGGLAKGELGVILAPTGVGKTTVLTKICNHAFNLGYNVLQIFFEDNPKIIQRKHFTMWTGIAPDDLSNHREVVIEKVKEIKLNTKNTLTLKKMPSDTMTMNQIKNQVRKMMAEGNKIDMIVIDYIDCIVPDRKLEDDS